MKNIVFLTKSKPTLSTPAYLRTIKLAELFKMAFNKPAKIINFYQQVNRVRLFFYTNKEIKKFFRCNNLKIEMIIICRLNPRAIKIVKNYCKKMGIKLYIDIVELSSFKEKKLGFLSPSLLMNHYVIKKSVDSSMTAIAISRFFEKYYLCKAIQTVYIPNLYSKNLECACINLKEAQPIRFGFIGFPQRKDALDIIMYSMIDLYRGKGSKFEFYVAGINEKQFFDKYRFLKKYREIINSFTTFFGYVDHEAVKEIYCQIHFSIIMRDPSLVVCQSGFPTKFVESLSYGRPVIANSTSDISCFLKNGYNGYIVKDYTSNSLLDILTKIIDQPLDPNIFSNSAKSAVDNFELSNFVDCLRNSYEEINRKN